jgi:hypothetical protein
MVFNATFNNISAITWRSISTFVCLMVFNTTFNNITNKRRYRSPRYSWNIVESGIKHHKTTIYWCISLFYFIHMKTINTRLHNYLFFSHDAVLKIRSHIICEC